MRAQDPSVGTWDVGTKALAIVGDMVWMFTTQWEQIVQPGTGVAPVVGSWRVYHTLLVLGWWACSLTRLELGHGPSCTEIPDTRGDSVIS